MVGNSGKHGKCSDKKQKSKNKVKDILDSFEKNYKRVKEKLLRQEKQIKELEELEEELKNREEDFNDLLKDINNMYSHPGTVRIIINRDQIKGEILKIAEQAEEKISIGAFRLPQNLNQANISILFDKIRNSRAKKLLFFYDRGNRSRTLKSTLVNNFNNKEVQCFPGKGNITHHRRFIFNERRGLILTCEWERFLDSSDLTKGIGVVINDVQEVNRIIREMKGEFS